MEGAVLYSSFRTFFCLVCYSTKENLSLVYPNLKCCILDPPKFLSWARDNCPNGIFAFHIGSKIFNVATDTTLVDRILATRKEFQLSHQPLTWLFMHRLFGISCMNREKYFDTCEELDSFYTYLVKEPYVDTVFTKISQCLQTNIPQMITFLDNKVDLQSWERWASSKYISSSETEISLMPLLYDMMGSTLVTSIFGSAFSEKYPDLMHNIYEMERGIKFLTMGIPAWFPWPNNVKAHMFRNMILLSLDDYQQALDNKIKNKPNGILWGDLDDVSEFVLARHRFYNEKKIRVEERFEIETLWNLTINANLLVFWHILFIYSTPGLVEKIRKEISLYASVTQGIKIGQIAEIPRVSLSTKMLFKECPLLKASYLETLRLTNQKWSIRAIENDVRIPKGDSFSRSLLSSLKKGQYIVVLKKPQIMDSLYMEYPEKFIPERFLLHNQVKSPSVNMDTSHFSRCGEISSSIGNEFLERACLSFVAGVIACWDLEPIDKTCEWKIPDQLIFSGICRPAYDVRVRIKRRCT
ncbi:hypothetical protein GcM3_044005 [Golovinomyces cichoracearum]|uniref:Cytochrome P450 n=1 Tax=Golovinomyces cichoracearum TaxID=62708 RepID=A0A420J1D2_9PEZI|nr:hypothetical protein GcM3_044005 [Golovinomyces cichoracearum]